MRVSITISFVPNKIFKWLDLLLLACKHAYIPAGSQLLLHDKQIEIRWVSTWHTIILAIGEPLMVDVATCVNQDREYKDIIPFYPRC